MAHDDIVYLAEWLAYRKMTAAELSRKTGIGESHLSLVISGSRRLSRKAENRIAAVLDIAFWQLYEPPAAASDTLIVKDLSPEEKRAAKSVVESFRTKKTNS